MGFYAVAVRYIEEMLSEHRQKATNHLSNLLDEYNAMAEQNFARAEKMCAVEQTRSDDEMKNLILAADAGEIESVIKYLHQGGYGMVAMEAIMVSASNGSWDTVHAGDIATILPEYVAIVDCIIAEMGMTDIVQWVNQQ
jgi:hypothetical protein